MVEFGYSLRRLELLKKTFEQLIETNRQLVAKNDKLLKEKEALQTLADARERVFKNLSEEENKKQLREEDRETVKES